MTVHESTLQGLQEALDYVRGDKTKGRTMTVEIQDEEVERNHTFIQDFYKLPEPSKVKAIAYVRELALQAQAV